jgi:hypothetical protein
MSCTCLNKKAAEILKSRTSKYPDRKIIGVDIDQTTIFNFKTGKDRQGTKSLVRITVDGIKKDVKNFIIHEYCPFCGKKHNP